MNKLRKNILAMMTLVQVGVLSAADVAVPNTFTPATPAKASEVNANFDALVKSLQGVKKVSLEQNNVVIGKSLMVNAFKFGDTILTNVIKLNSGYAIAPYDDIGKGQMALMPTKSGAFTYFSSNNCSGTRYTSSKFKDDPIFGTTGYVVAISGTAAYIPSPVIRINDLVINSVRGSDGVCVNFAEYLPYPGTGSGYCDNYYSMPGARVKEISYTSGYWVAPGDGYWDYSTDNYVTNGAAWLWNAYPEKTCQPLGSPVSYEWSHDDGTGTHNTTYEYVLVPPLEIGKAKALTGTLKEATPFLTNNPAVTGVTTAACTDTRSRPAVCLPNAVLKD